MDTWDRPDNLEPEQRQAIGKWNKSPKIMSTGNMLIDKTMGGGIPTGSLTLIDGHSDAGKSVLSQQIIWGSLQKQSTVTVFTTENTVRSLIAQMDNLNLGILDPLLLDYLRIYPVRLMEGKDKIKQALDNLFISIGYERERDLVIVDSLTPFVTHISSDEAIGFFSKCRRLCNHGTTIILVVHSYACEDNIFSHIESMCDAHFRLLIDETDDKLQKRLEMTKVRGCKRAEHNVVSFEVESGIGMKVLTCSKVTV
ncbi:MAG: ATPase domain-containing protein [Chloroflexota bacterium]|nr:ATPase domain-containing protein [Chloroflexota bacterium]